MENNITEIKTVWNKADKREEFDYTVNSLIKEGYKLDRIEVCSSRHNGVASMFFALLTN